MPLRSFEKLRLLNPRFKTRAVPVPFTDDGQPLPVIVLCPGLQHMQDHRVTCLALKISFECTNPELRRSFMRGSVISD